jgi:hypothetical protein
MAVLFVFCCVHEIEIEEAVSTQHSARQAIGFDFES